MLVSAVSMNGIIPSIKNSKQSNPNSVSNSSNDTFQKSQVSFGSKLPFSERVVRDANKVLNDISLSGKVEKFVEDADDCSLGGVVKMAVGITTGFADLLVIAPLTYTGSFIKNLISHK